jgi:GNAT superfamily N-acetyltransferase
MARLELRPFADQYLDTAARLLAARHERHRAAEPLLAEVDARAAVEETWRRDRTSGAAAVRGRRLVGYVVGSVGERRYLGRSAWIDRAGHAAADGEILRDLYATAAETWVAAGVERHFANVPVGGEWLEPWYRLGFAQMHVAALRASGGDGADPPAGVTIRRGGPDDIETAAVPLNQLIMALQAASPSFLPVPLTVEEERADWAATFEDPDAAYFVAEQDGRVLGHSLLYPADPEFGTPPDAVYLASTATVPEVRGSGVGIALTSHVLAWAREAGYGAVATNWRVTNLLASRFWPARGFRPTFVRLVRALGTG